MLNQTLSIKKKLFTYWHLTRQQKWMFCVNILLSGLAKLAVYCLSYKNLAHYFGNSCRMLVASTMVSEEEKRQAMIIRRSIALVSRHTPWQSNCLNQALMAKFWCQYYHIHYLLFIGLSIQKNAPINRNAHAWLMVGPIDITGGNCFMTHQVISSYSNCCTSLDT
jgi:hypothetical protein